MKKIVALFKKNNLNYAKISKLRSFKSSQKENF
ncbi:hypothetical protein J2780_002116 [Chryseobacterium camelliae]|nr:hypothetical protein [Chryseobacterium camelliae]